MMITTIKPVLSNNETIRELKILLNKSLNSPLEEYEILRKLYILGMKYGHKGIFKELDRLCTKFCMHPITGMAYLLKLYPYNTVLYKSSMYLLNQGQQSIPTTSDENKAKEYVDSLVIQRLNQQFYSQ